MNNNIFNSLDDVYNYLDKINNTSDMDYNYIKYMSYELLFIYEWMLEEVLKLEEKPKRVVDIGSCLNQYAYLFVNNGIKYIGIDCDKTYNPIESEDIVFIHSQYEDVKDEFKNDVIISNLCVGFFIPEEKVKAKVIINGKNYRDNAKLK